MNLKFRVDLEQITSPHMLENDKRLGRKRFRVTVNGKPWEPYGRDSGDVYFNTRGYLGALPQITGGVFAPGECGISVYRKEVARINAEAAALIERAKSDRHRVGYIRNSADPRYATLGLTSGEEVFVPFAQLRLLDGQHRGMGESLARPMSLAELPPVPRYMVQDAIHAIGFTRDLEEGALAAVRAEAQTPESEAVLLRLRATMVQLASNAPMASDPLAIKAGIVARWLDEDALPRHAKMRRAIESLMRGNTCADDRVAQFSNTAFVEARAAEDAAEAAIAAMDAGAPDLMARINEACEIFEDLPDGTPRDVEALEELALLLRRGEPEDEPESTVTDGPGF